MAGKLCADPACTDQRAPIFSARALASVLYSQTRVELFRIYTLCLLGGARYNLASIPENFNVGADAMGFDPVGMTRL